MAIFSEAPIPSRTDPSSWHLLWEANCTVAFEDKRLQERATKEQNHFFGAHQTFVHLFVLIFSETAKPSLTQLHNNYQLEAFYIQQLSTKNSTLYQKLPILDDHLFLFWKNLY